MQKLMQWIGSQGEWTSSPWALPVVPLEAEAVSQRWAVVAGGLALILSRAGAPERSARFARTHEAYLLIQGSLRQARPVTAGADLLGEVMHEIAEVADPFTRNALRACFGASLRTAAVPGPEPEPRLSQPASSMQRLSRISGRQTVTGRPRDDADTAFRKELLQERSTALRKSVAAARTTSFAELR